MRLLESSPPGESDPAGYRRKHQSTSNQPAGKDATFSLAGELTTCVCIYCSLWSGVVRLQLKPQSIPNLVGFFFFFFGSVTDHGFQQVC